MACHYLHKIHGSRHCPDITYETESMQQRSHDVLHNAFSEQNPSMITVSSSAAQV
ncbi:hypothetical protein PISMIDRAFT_194496 [Pisolithus microcarpus 441]|uniref:Uncharacterized protein n=1 Tax=Pisolithus microcarpus 441 TaxID=765257 RepID=A0A0C9Z758_9AGAM|nr:hypothetical protein PISMIDRAFT_194496 [Pisolithus microcarpus 441]